MSEKNEIQLRNCGFVKTVFMICVVLYHSILFWNGEWYTEEPVYSSQLLGLLSKWFNSFHISGFTLVSGYIFGYLFYEKHAYNDFRKFILKKIKRLIVPYLFVSVLWIIPIVSFVFRYTPTDIIKKFALGISPSQLWFLLMLFNVFLISYIVFSLINEKVFLSVFAAVGLFIVSIIGNHYLPNCFQIFTAFQFFTYFIVGVNIRYYREK